MYAAESFIQTHTPESRQRPCAGDDRACSKQRKDPTARIYRNRFFGSVLQLPQGMYNGGDVVRYVVRIRTNQWTAL